MLKQGCNCHWLTGSGKTEFQKYLLRKIPTNKRIILIDNVLELEQVREQTKLDLNTWKREEFLKN